MAGDLPEYFFRIRDNGAVVFRIDSENRQRRIEMEEIAVVNVKNGNVKPHGERKLTPEESKLIAAWITERQAILAARDIDDILRAVDHMNLTTQWVQTRATDADLDRVTDDLLLSMHDLRTVLVRKKAERLMQAAEDAPQK